MRKVTLPNNVRLLVSLGDGTIGLAGEYLEAGEELLVGDPEVTMFESEECAVVSFFYGGKQYFMLVRESGLNDKLTD